MQGGVISPLLANIALHGLETMLNEFAVTIDYRNCNGYQENRKNKIKSLNFIRYADDFLVLHRDLTVVHRCRELISEWLNGMGLELNTLKTRITHTLNPKLSEDGTAGFDFLGHHIQQFPVGKHNCAIDPRTRKPIGFRTLIRPSKDACKKHQREIKDVIKRYKNLPQALIIQKLNPVIRGWIEYYSNSDANTVGELARQDYLLFQKLRAWGRHKCKGNLKKAYKKYWKRIGNRNWVFTATQENANPLRLLSHTEFGSSSTKYVKVKGKDSPFNGNLVYWSTRMGRNPDMPPTKANLLKSQKGVCPWCCLSFREADVLEVDHILAKALGGKNEYKNLQLLHGHCHDEKTSFDLLYIKENSFKCSLKHINKELDKYNWFWKDDILCVTEESKKERFSDKNRYFE